MQALVFDAYGTLFDVTSVITTCGKVTSDPEAFAALSPDDGFGTHVTKKIPQGRRDNDGGCRHNAALYE